MSPDVRQEGAGVEAVFLGSSGCIQVPAFFCDCVVCEAARRDPAQRRTRASLAVLGKEIVLIDASPDLDAQLERERLRRVDRLFITHWHADHVAGLFMLGEPARAGGWEPVDVYVPEQAAFHFDQELAYLGPKVQPHPVKPGDRIELPDAAWEVVKTNHTPESVGYVVEAGRKLAYLADGAAPPPETCERLQGVDVLSVEAILDELDEQWLHFALPQAVEFWKSTGIPECILTHMSCHGWREGRLVAGLSHAERLALEGRTPGLAFAREGMRLVL